jgi:hypothetical protein
MAALLGHSPLNILGHDFVKPSPAHALCNRSNRPRPIGNTSVATTSQARRLPQRKKGNQYRGRAVLSVPTGRCHSINASGEEAGRLGGIASSTLRHKIVPSVAASIRPTNSAIRTNTTTLAISNANLNCLWNSWTRSHAHKHYGNCNYGYLAQLSAIRDYGQ